MRVPVLPPLTPMLCKLARELPSEAGPLVFGPSDVLARIERAPFRGVLELGQELPASLSVR